MVIPRVKGKRREIRRMLVQRSNELLARYRRGEPAEGCPSRRHCVRPPGQCDSVKEAKMNILRTHHVAVICSDYGRSKDFYARILGPEVVAEVFRAERDSYKLDLRLPDGVQIELFSFPEPAEAAVLPRGVSASGTWLSRLRTSTRRWPNSPGTGSRSSRCGWIPTPASGSRSSPTRTGCRWSCTSDEQ